MGSKLLTFKDAKTGKRFIFNPLFIGCIMEHHNIDGAICIDMIAGGDETTYVINYPYEDAQKRWVEAINS